MIYFIVNKSARSGKGATIWREVRAVLKNENIEYKACETKYEGHAAELAGQVSRLPEEDITLVVLGGDGTVNEVINGITDFEKVRLGVIPTGSGNDFARGLKLKGSTKDYVYKILYNGEERRIDLGEVRWNECEEPRYFAISSGIGMDAIVCKRALTSKLKKFLNRIHLGKLTYLLLTLQTLFDMETARVEVDFENGNKKIFHKLIFAAAMNFRAEGGGVPMAPHADAEDGMLSLCFAHGIPKQITFFVLPFLVMAMHEKLPCFHIEDSRICRMHTDKPMVLHADGEYCGEATDVYFTCMPKKLRVIV